MSYSQKTVTKPIRIAQLNAQRKIEVVTNLLNSHHKYFDIIILQEPAWSFIGKNNGVDIKGPVAATGWTPLIPVTTGSCTDRPRTMTYYRTRADFTVTLRTDILEDKDVQILDISQIDQPNITIINVYNDPTRNEESALARLRNMNINSLATHPTIITGDFNLHHTLWSVKPVISHAKQAEDVVEWLSENGYMMLNTKGEITHPSRNQREEGSVIDLSFANAIAITHDTFKDWAVDPAIAHDSDHFGIKFTIDQGRKEVDNPMATKYSLKETNPEDWAKAFQDELDNRKHIFDPLISQATKLTSAQLDLFADTLTGALQTSTAKVAKIKSPSTKSKPWWDKDLTEAATDIARVREEQAAFQTAAGEFNKVIRSKIRRSRNFFKRLCKFKKRQWATNTLQNANSADIWSFPEWSKGSRNYPTPPISKGPNINDKATTHQDKCDALRNELYQPPPPLEREFIPDLENPIEDQLPYQKITEDEVREAIFNSSSDTAPGYSQIPYKVLKWAWNNNDGRKYITTLMQKCLETGYHPQAWRKAIAVALRKPNKPDYSNPRAYRLITLLECLGKVLEKIIAKRLTFLAGKYNLIPTSQFGGVANTSTCDAILSFTHDIRAAWNHGLVTSALSFDIKGYFDFVNHNRLLCELRRKKVPLPYIKWTASFLRDREAAVCIDGRRGEMKPVQNGIPQGSPISPILAAFYTAELLENFPKRFEEFDNKEDKSTGTHIFIYVDDGTLVTSSTSLTTNCKVLKRAYEITEEWLRSAGLSSDVSKRELMHYSNRKKDNSNPAITVRVSLIFIYFSLFISHFSLLYLCRYLICLLSLIIL